MPAAEHGIGPVQRRRSTSPRLRQQTSLRPVVPGGRASAGVVVLVALFAGPGAVGAQAQTASGPVLRLPPAGVLGSAASADAAPRRIGGEDPNLCVSVDIAGERAGHLDCAGKALEAAAASARREAEAGRGIGVAGAGSPDIQVGVASRSGTRLRLRENFGVSVRPPAAAAPAVPPTVGSRQ